MANSDWKSQIEAARTQLFAMGGGPGERKEPEEPNPGAIRRRQPGPDPASPYRTRTKADFIRHARRDTPGALPESMPSALVSPDLILEVRRTRLDSIRPPDEQPSNEGRSTARRTSRCFNCKSRVDSGKHQVCPDCRVLSIICPDCGCCGCYFLGWDGQNSPLTDGPITDNVDWWVLLRSDRIIFPAVTDSEVWQSTDPAVLGRKLKYGMYLRSRVWREKRIGALKNADHRCEECGTQKTGLHVHHTTYARVGGEELPEDLEVLCEACHFKVHAWASRHARWLREATSSKAAALGHEEPTE